MNAQKNENHRTVPEMKTRARDIGLAVDLLSQQIEEMSREYFTIKKAIDEAETEVVMPRSFFLPARWGNGCVK